jgi:hypothetical protein
VTAKSMDVFSLRDTVVRDYERFATSFTTIAAPDIKAQVAQIYEDKRFWPEPLLQINPNYKAGKSVQQLADLGVLHQTCAQIFPLGLYWHQEMAISVARSGESYVVTTGTGSGKSLCFFIPIVDAILTERVAGAPRKTSAIVVYPMNALANSQAEEIAKYLKNVPDPKPITVARYTGQESQEERQRIAENPPDILLTNFMMLELLLTRQEDVDKQVVENCAGLRFLVLDELHTYRGRQGADVALLVRRLDERLNPAKLQCIGTSATMASEGNHDDRNAIVARVASQLFGRAVPAANVIVETLERVTNAETPTGQPALAAAVDAGIPAGVTDAQLRANPLARWTEEHLGITFEDLRWVRAKPKSLSQAQEALAAASGRDPSACGAQLRKLLLQASIPEDERLGEPPSGKRSFFAFKLHQFIAGAGKAYATLEPPPERKVTVESQLYLPEDPQKRLYALHFCRECGQEYHPVRLKQEEGAETLHQRDIDDTPPRQSDKVGSEPDDEEGKTDEGEFGFVTLDDPEFLFRDPGSSESWPEAWCETSKSGQLVLKRNYRPALPRSIQVGADGKLGSGNVAWFTRGKFRLCLRCLNTISGAARDRNRLAALSAEGRSSATTVLVGSVLRWMHGDNSGMAEFSRKLLGFTDNRQDAALQAGHFNDFLFVSLVRAGFLAALTRAGEAGLRSEKLGVEQQRALGFDRRELRQEWLGNPDMKGVNLEDAEETLRDVLTYRVWFDQRRGWRYTNPNLGQLGLLKVRYRGIDDLAADDAAFEDAPLALRGASPAIRRGLLTVLFDYMRESLAVTAAVLDRVTQEGLVKRSKDTLRRPWALNPDDAMRASRWLVLQAPSKAKMQIRDDERLARGGFRSALGAKLRDSELWGAEAVGDVPRGHELEAAIFGLLRAAAEHGLVDESLTSLDDVTGWRLRETVVVFERGEPMPGSSGYNPFFVDYYENLAHLLGTPDHPVFGFESREHTAQVDAERREIREKRFRYGEKERDDLAKDDNAAKLDGTRFLPVLFCSPTMELGVDISALNAVYLRNVPPTPANYAQRSGRAGRSGQAALVLTYAAAQSPHDQYFFQDPARMVHGQVREPMLELANRELVVSHLQATWLACTGAKLRPSIAEALLLGQDKLPLNDELKTQMTLPAVTAKARNRILRVLKKLEVELTPERAPWFAAGPEAFADEVVAKAFAEFDKALDRWRTLYETAIEQRDRARRMIDDHSISNQDKKRAYALENQAYQQIALLQQSESQLSSDFYTYRYLATEGFLPGYNFPRLPLMAYVPASNDGQGKQTFLQRPRFLALSEFGPYSLVYHEGRMFRVVRARLPIAHVGTVAAGARLPTNLFRICASCGAGHGEDSSSFCVACGASLSNAAIVNEVYRIDNVDTRQAERITANDEERQRQGFDLRTTFEWAPRDHGLDKRDALATDELGELARLTYGGSAKITRLNLGLRRRRDKAIKGFMIDPITGYWAKVDDDAGDTPVDPTTHANQLVVPAVSDRKNALLYRPLGLSLDESAMATIQYALLRGLETVFQLEQGEMLAEPMPTSADRKAFLLYEATEGGAGVLTRLVAEPTRLQEVARKALELMHYAVPETLPTDAAALENTGLGHCVAACYHCLMSYYNQPDHELLDRRNVDAIEHLLRLARANVGTLADLTAPFSGPPVPPPGASLLEWAQYRGLGPDEKPLQIAGAVVEAVWKSQYVAALAHDVSASVLGALEDQGYKVVLFAADAALWPETLDLLAGELGRA